MEYKEFSGKTVDDALTNASIELGVTSEHLNYEVVEKGSTGFLGFASKNAVIRVAIDTDADGKAETKNDAEMTDSSDSQNTPAESSADETESEKNEENDSAEQTDAAAEKKNSDRNHDKKPSEEAVQEAKEIAEQFLKDVFKEMELEVTISESYDEENRSLNIDLEGPEMGIIIGKRGQTLDSLQYLTNLAVNRKINAYIRVKIDTEDYRERRKETLENLAHNVAYKVKKTRRPVALESMNPYERRIIHAALSEDEYVTTHSEGEEPYRHVVVTLK